MKAEVIRRRIPLMFLAMMLVLPRGYAQVAYNQTPLDVPTDARGVGMGESLIALRANPSALLYNPAGIASLKGVGVGYAEREMNWFDALEDFEYYGFNAYVETPLGVFGARYDRFFMGTTTAVLANNPQGYVEASSYQHDVILGYGTQVGRGFEIGASAKYFDYVTTVSGGADPEGTVSAPSTTPAWLFDGGVVYSVPGLDGGGSPLNELTFAISLENLGTKIIFHSEPGIPEQDQPLPEYFHAGCALKAAIPAPEGAAHSLVAATLTFEYTNLLNYTSGRTGGYAYWGAGLEFVLGGIISLRGGSVLRPQTSIYGEGGSLAYRYGAGITLPLARLGIPVPIVLSAAYSAIPLFNVNLGFFSAQRHTLDDFSFEVSME
jgi:hypothetical protein